MTNYNGPIYESTFVVMGDVRDEFNGWLQDVRTRALLEAEIHDARLFDRGLDDHGKIVVTCQFRAHDDAALNKLVDGFFVDLDSELADKFGESIFAESQVLRTDGSQELPLSENLTCLNCGAHLRGQYCGNCGQRSTNRLISLWQLLREAFGDLLELDSRVWRTLIPLLIKPGQLTKDYLQGRRARYMPPFRTYLVLSVLFFVVAFFNPRDELSLLYEPEPEPTAEEIEEKEDDARIEAAEEQEKIDAAKEELKDLADAGIIPAEVESEIDSGGFNISFDEDGGGCEIDAEDRSEMPPWLEKRLTPERLKRVCERIDFDDGESFIDLLLDKIPVALIVLLPLMALALKLLYPLSRRYFVEHLLFFVHFHAFFFLILTLQILFSRAAGLLAIPDAIPILVSVAASLYIPVYLFIAMRRVYSQGRLFTLIKYVVLVTTYIMGASLTLLSAVLFALLSI